jgi:hypothetical protein
MRNGDRQTALPPCGQGASRGRSGHSLEREELSQVAPTSTRTRRCLVVSCSAVTRGGESVVGLGRNRGQHRSGSRNLVESPKLVGRSTRMPVASTSGCHVGRPPRRRTSLQQGICATNHHGGIAGHGYFSVNLAQLTLGFLTQDDHFTLCLWPGWTMAPSDPCGPTASHKKQSPAWRARRLASCRCRLAGGYARPPMPRP